jgi:flavin reductase (DIM6/NTAB) family NADH-FMN oxidoreductase RutF
MTKTKDLRECLGRFATGITVVTCLDANDQPCGITVNSFSSVSLEPPLVLWSIANVSHSLEAYLDAEFFAINVLAANQRQLSAHFAGSDHTVFDGIDYSRSEHGVPLLPDSLARLECATEQVHAAGDHYIIIGKVESFEWRDGQPLLYFGGDYATLA